jgi:hypothetical protein
MGTTEREKTAEMKLETHWLHRKHPKKEVSQLFLWSVEFFC